MTLVHEDVSTQVVTVVVVAAMPVVRDGLRAMLGRENGIVVTAEAASTRDAVQLAAEYRPDVLLADVGEYETMCLSVQRFGTAVLAFTDEEDDRSVVAAIRAGVRGYLPRSADIADLARAIRSVAGGQVVFGVHVAGRVTELLLAHSAAKPFADLTPREREILDLLAQGLSNAMISHRLRVTPKTIRNNVSGILAKLGVAGRDEAIALARTAGLGHVR